MSKELEDLLKMFALIAVFLFIIGVALFRIRGLEKEIDALKNAPTDTITIVKTDTLRIAEPVPVYKYIKEKEYVTITDSLLVYDTITKVIELPREYLVYKDTSYRAVVSGVQPRLDSIEVYSKTITETALCGLGQSACKPVISTLKYFRNEYLAHVVDKHCPHCNGSKKAMKIDPEKCKGCGKCKRLCPMEAIDGQIRSAHTIDPEKCIKCGACVSGCPFGAISEE